MNYIEEKTKSSADKESTLSSIYVQQLLTYKKQFGDCLVSHTKSPEEFRRLASWVSKQRTNYREGKLSQEDISLLEGIGFVWKAETSALSSRYYQQLLEYKERFGDCLVSQTKSPEEYKNLAAWVSAQRMKYRKGKLSKEVIEQLDAIGFVWDAHHYNWEQMFNKYVEFVTDNGPYAVIQDPKLNEWVTTQRRNKKLSKEYTERLNSVGFVWDANAVRLDIYGEQWEEMYQELKEASNTFGSCLIPGSYLKYHPKLKNWISTQRYLKNSLSADRIEKLNELGFSWNPLETQWEEMYQELKEARQLFGSCHIPRSYLRKRPKLETWIKRQRDAMKEGKISKDRFDRLNEIDFAWDLYEVKWNEVYQELKEIKEINDKYGEHTVSLKDHPDCQKLQSWISFQRSQKKQGKMSQDRIDRLNAIDFVW